MKKLIVILALLVLFQTFHISVYANTSSHNQNNKNSEVNDYQDMLLILLEPYIEDEVNKYYLQYLDTPPVVYLYEVKFINIKKIKKYEYHIKVFVSPVYGPHNSVGDDYITFKIDIFNTVSTVKFEHIRSYKLPKHYEGHIKEGYKNPIP